MSLRGSIVRIAVQKFEIYAWNMRTRLPFRYGIASMTAVPYLLVRCQLRVNGAAQPGIAADILPPKWFTKDPNTTFREDLPAMLRVIESACGLAERIGEAETVFDLWRQLYDAQERWAATEGYPPLLWNFGVSLAERAVIEAFCRATQTPFADAVRTNSLGIRLGAIYPELADDRPIDLLPAQPLRSLRVRHTIGLTDPITDEEIADVDRLHDGLPQSLEASIRAYGLTHFKIKIGGNPSRDIERLKRIAAVLERAAPHDYAFTLDGNETYTGVEPFRQLWQSLCADAELTGFLRRLIFVEQPLHRDVTLSEEARKALHAWPERPPILIDESDARIGSVKEALACGYVGTSHKNCKGIFKGIANACLLEHLRRAHPARLYLLSGEDLCNVGPVALLQDLAVLATLGVDHAERNGHHYFRGLSMFPSDVQAQTLAHHPDLYQRHPDGFPSLRIQDGQIALGSVVQAPFGVGFEIDPSAFMPLAVWDPDSLFEE